MRLGFYFCLISVASLVMVAPIASAKAQHVLTVAGAHHKIEQSEPGSDVKRCHRIAARHINCLVGVRQPVIFESEDPETGEVTVLREYTWVLLRAKVGLRGVAWRLLEG